MHIVTMIVGVVKRMLTSRSHMEESALKSQAKGDTYEKGSITCKVNQLIYCVYSLETNLKPTQKLRHLLVYQT